MSESSRDRWDRIRRTPAVPAALSYDEAVELLVDCDPAAFYESLVSLSRPSHGELLQPLPYSPDLTAHIPGCIVIEPEPTDVETVARFYRERFDRSNLTERNETRISGSLILSAASPENSANSVQVSISSWRMTCATWSIRVSPAERAASSAGSGRNSRSQTPASSE